ncbi:MAG: HAD family hydrolase [Chloroflexi bacterium]|nr:HAD family hydrolase [Chloroflexota bacterium]
MASPIRLIVTDLDGTLLNSAHEISPHTEQSLREAMSRGIPLVLATGKTRTSALHIIEHLGLTTPGVYIQGLTVYSGAGELLYQQTLAADPAHIAIEAAIQGHYPTVIYSGTRILTDYKSPQTDILTHYHEPQPEAVGPLREIIEHVPVHKLTFIDEPARITALRAHLKEHIGDVVTLVQALDTMLEVLPPGASKGNGLSHLLELIQMPPEHVIAFGDGENDMGMLQLAGIGVAMGNSKTDVQKAADYVTASNDHDGIAQALERFVLN